MVRMIHDVNSLREYSFDPLSHKLILFTDFGQIRYSRVFKATDYKSEIRFSKFIMAVQYGGYQIENLKLSHTKKSRTFDSKLLK